MDEFAVHNPLRMESTGIISFMFMQQEKHRSIFFLRDATKYPLFDRCVYKADSQRPPASSYN